MRERTLRTYQRCAQIEHFCDRCFEPIFPGQMYEGCVQTTNRGIMVLKNHVEPACDWPEPPDEDEMDEEGWDDIGLPLAA